MILQFPINMNKIAFGDGLSETRYARPGKRFATVGSFTGGLTVGHTPTVKVYKMSEEKARLAQPSSKFKVENFSEIGNTTETNWLIKGILPSEGNVTFYGGPKTAKSFLVLDMSMHVALGWPYRGRDVEQGAVVYLVCEGAGGFRNRIEAFRQHRLSEGMTHIPFYLISSGINLSAEHGDLATSISAAIGSRPLKMLVIDTLNRSLHGSENSDVDMGSYIKAMDYLRDYFGCLVVPIHHCGHEKNRPRGHSSLAAAADAQILVKKKGGKITFSVELMKDGESGEEFVADLKIVEIGCDKSGDPITSCIIEHSEDLEEKIMKLVAGGMNYRDTATELNISKDQVYRVVKRNSVAPSHPSLEGVRKSVGAEPNKERSI